MIRSYPAQACVEQGGSLELCVSSDAPRFGVTFARCGRRVETVSQTEPTLIGRNVPASDAGVRWQWPAYEFAVPDHWPAGVYVAVLATSDDSPLRGQNGKCAADARSARALFVVRERGVRNRLLVVLPLFTYHAYNVADVDGTAGQSEGSCLYSGTRWVSLHRPGGGSGGHPWDEVNVDVYDRETPRQTFAHWDAKALAWLEEHGYPYDCCTDVELHDGTIDLGMYRAIVSFGHHEYWTPAMRERIDAYVASGGNVAFFGGNTCWFRAQYDETQPAVRRDGRWLDDPEWKTTGVSYACGGGKWIGPRPPSGYRVCAAKHWIYDGLPVADNETFGALERLLGYECDAAPPSSDLEILAEASLEEWDVSDGSGELSATASATLGIRKNGGQVFTASTVDWARVLWQGEPVVGGITRNVLEHFLR